MGQDFYLTPPPGNAVVCILRLAALRASQRRKKQEAHTGMAKEGKITLSNLGNQWKSFAHPSHHLKSWWRHQVIFIFLTFCIFTLLVANHHDLSLMASGVSCLSVPFCCMYVYVQVLVHVLVHTYAQLEEVKSQEFKFSECHRHVLKVWILTRTLGLL